jgi:hypothetical protein
MNIIVVHVVVENRKDICAIGWAEDKPHDGESAVLLNEPLYCIFNGPQIRFVGPSWGLPCSTEIFEYTRLDVYEGITALAALYIQHVLKAREYKPIFEGGFVPETALHGKVQVSAQQQKEGR